MSGPIVDKFGTIRWYQNGKLHRLDGPAIECVNDDKEWYQYGERHREDGPACEWESDGTWHEKMVSKWFNASG